MVATDRMKNDYYTSPVAAASTVSGIEIGIILAGIKITIPQLVFGAALGLQLGLSGMIVSVLWASLITTLIAIPTSLIGTQTRLTTYLIVERAFGAWGAKLVNLVAVGTLSGWFAVTAEFLGQTVHVTVRTVYGFDPGRLPFILMGVILVLSITLFGFKGINRMSRIVVPLLLLLLGYAVYLSMQDKTVSDLFALTGSAIDIPTAISAMVGSSMVGIVTRPDLTRFARSNWDSVLANLIGATVAFPILLLIPGVLALATGKKDIVDIMLGLGLVIPALLVLVLSAVKTNAANLYSSSLVVRSVFTQLGDRTAILVIAAIGTLLACIGIIELFIPFLLSLGIVVTPIAGIYLCEHYIVRRYLRRETQDEPAAKVNYLALVIWAVSIVGGYLTTLHVFTLTSVPAVDSLLFSIVLYAITRRWIR